MYQLIYDSLNSKGYALVIYENELQLTPKQMRKLLNIAHQVKGIDEINANSSSKTFTLVKDFRGLQNLFKNPYMKKYHVKVKAKVYGKVNGVILADRKQLSIYVDSNISLHKKFRGSFIGPKGETIRDLGKYLNCMITVK